MRSAAAVFAVFAAALSSPMPLMALDEAPTGTPCTKDASFNQFIVDLKIIVRRKQVSRLLAVTQDDVQSRFPFELGKSDFMLQWYLKDSPNKSVLWPTMRKILNRPCTQKEGYRFMDDGDPDGYFMFAQKVRGRWMIAGISGEAD